MVALCWHEGKQRIVNLEEPNAHSCCTCIPPVRVTEVSMHPDHAAKTVTEACCLDSATKLAKICKTMTCISGGPARLVSVCFAVTGLGHGSGKVS